MSPGPGSVACPKVPPGALTSVEARVQRRKDRKAKDKQWAKVVLARDRWKCRVAGFGEHAGPIDPHHVRPKSVDKGRRWDRRNGAALCRKHHTDITAYKLAIVFLDPKQGADGSLRFVEGPAA